MDDGYVLQEEAAKALSDVLRKQIQSQLKTGSVSSKAEKLRAIFREYDRDGSKFIR
jgi:proteasome assembly chaperone (PAC2) family protein